jgi:hypothetical protein
VAKKRTRASEERLLESLAWKNAARAVFASLAGALLKNGLDRDAIAAALDAALFDAAGSEANALRAGLSRAALARLRKAGRDDILLPLSYRSATRLVSRWQLSPEFSENGRPRTLPLYGEGSFATLAAMVGADPKSLLSRLRRVGAVRVASGSVSLRENAYIPAAGRLEKIDILGRDAAEFLQTMIHNVSAPAGKTMLQRRASYDNIGSAALKELRAVLRTGGQAAVEGANRELAARDRDRNPRAPRGRRTRVSFAVYCYEGPVETGSAVEARKKGGRRS